MGSPLAQKMLCLWGGQGVMKPDLSRETILGQMAPLLSWEEARSRDYVIVDVRSAAEYHSGTVPKAVNVPLFDENERTVIGTLYKRAGKQFAVDRGVSFAKEKLESLLDGFRPYNNGPFAILCARGGMRSRSIANLLNQTGCKAVQIVGGYKRFRAEVLKKLEQYAPPLIVLHGLTGTGKTRILQSLDNVIDLEDLAQHRSSLFGALGFSPRNQRDFEAFFVEELKALGEPPYFVEGESRKIGPVFIPQPFFLAMKGGVLVNITASLETRITRIIEDYPVETVERKDEVAAILHSLTYAMGKTKVEELCRNLVEGDLRPFVRTLLLEYYDKRYNRSMQNYTFQLELSSESIDECADKLTSFRNSLFKRDRE